MFESVSTLKAEGTTILLVEQNAYGALAVADYAYVLRVGEMWWRRTRRACSPTRAPRCLSRRGIGEWLWTGTGIDTKEEAMRYLKSVTMAVAGAVAMAALPAGAFQDEGTVRIGSTEPLTGPGAVYGQPNIVGKFIAVDEINAAGGIMIDGKQVKIDLISEDDQAKPDQGSPSSASWKGRIRRSPSPAPSTSRVSETMWGLLQKKLDDAGDTGLQVPSMSFMSMKAGVASISPWAFRNAGVECDQHEELMQLVEKANGGNFTNVVGALESNEAHSAAAWRVCYQARSRSATRPPRPTSSVRAGHGLLRAGPAHPQGEARSVHPELALPGERRRHAGDGPPGG